jgi:hypothetical protein
LSFVQYSELIQHRYVTILVSFDRYTLYLVPCAIWRWIVRLSFEKHGQLFNWKRKKFVKFKGTTRFISRPVFFKLCGGRSWLGWSESPDEWNIFKRVKPLRWFQIGFIDGMRLWLSYM